MADEELTDRQRARLQRWFDGELDEPTRTEVEKFVETAPAAREYLERLREVRDATAAAHDSLLSSSAPLPPAEEIVAAARRAPDAEERPLEDLAPLIERYYDGETVDGETRDVEQLLEQREDAADYLAALRDIGDSVREAQRQARSGIDFDAFRDDLQQRLEVDVPNVELLHRYIDGEVSEEESDRAEQWLDRDERAAEAVDALEQLGEATRMAEREVQSRSDLENFWSGVENRLDELEESTADPSGEVVSPDRTRSREQARQTDDETPDTGDARTGTVVELFSEYRPHLAGAAAAAVLLVAIAALLRPGVFQTERVVVKEKKTVVIVDSVEQRSGSSVVVDGPMRRVSAQSDGEPPESKSEDSTGETSGGDSEKPTVIWLLDSDGQSGAKPSDSPAQKAPDHGDASDKSRDAGGADTAPSPSGQPI